MILVDDGSPDNCGAICDEYAAKDTRVKVIHQQNGGVSAARQTGIMHATGGYSIHTDPDDWVEANMIEELVAKAKALTFSIRLCLEPAVSTDRFMSNFPSSRRGWRFSRFI